MSEVDPRLVAAIERQLRDRQGERIGWKLGIGDRERIGDELAVGHLTSATLLEPGASYTPDAGEVLHADAEVVVEIGPDGWIARYGAALELVDLRSPPTTAEDVVAQNIFHRGVAIGRSRGPLPAGGVEAQLLVNGEVRASGRSAPDLADRIRSAAEVLAAVGQRLEPGDLVITGSVVQVPVEPGDEVEADLGELGGARLRVSARSQPPLLR